MARTRNRTRNAQLAAVIVETSLSQEQVAARMVRVAAEVGATELLGITRSHVSQWILGSQPKGRAALILCETLSRHLRRRVTPAEVGLQTPLPDAAGAPEWSVDTLTCLLDLGSSEVDMERRRVLEGAAYSLAGLALPGQSWWDEAPERARTRPSVTGRGVGRSEVDDVREMTAFFSRRDQRRGGSDGRATLVAYLHTNVADYLSGTFPDEKVRRSLYSAAGESVYLAGWMAFDASKHAVAKRYFTLAVRLAAEADDPPLAGHILRAMAHQAVDLGHPQPALDLATASVDRKRFTLASPRERALLGVVHARSLAVSGQKKDALAALSRAESDLAAAGPGDEEPSRVWFFGEASLAHETACLLRDIGDLDGSRRAFRRSVRTRKVDTFSRTHAVTLGYLGAVQARQGSVEEACATWSQALDAMDGVQSGRARDTVVDMRRVLSPFRKRGISAVAELDDRAREVLGRVV